MAFANAKRPRQAVGCVMIARRRLVKLALMLLLAAGTPPIVAQESETAITSPRWMLELKAGRFEPDLDGYQRFYGNDEARYRSVEFAYRFRRWLEFGGGLAHMRDKGVGLLSISGALGGEVTYTLMPVHAFFNLRGDFNQDQLVVPYIGVGVTRSYYKQKIELQPKRTGTSDLGTIVRVGLQLSLLRLGAESGSQIQRSYLFVEAQRFTTEVDDIDLGGDVFLLGFRFEFGKDSAR